MEEYVNIRPNLLRCLFTDELFYMVDLHDFTYLHDEKTPK